MRTAVSTADGWERFSLSGDRTAGNHLGGKVRDMVSLLEYTPREVISYRWPLEGPPYDPMILSEGRLHGLFFPVQSEGFPLP